MNIRQIIKKVSRFLAISLFSLLEIIGLPKISPPENRQRRPGHE